jgi:signal peptidase I
MMKDKKRIVREYAEAIITALLLALVIRAYIVQAFKIPSGSMIPTLLIGDHLLVNKFIYGTKIPFSDKRILIFGEPAKKDIIVFKYPKDPEKDFIKRVMAVGGDQIESKNKVIFVNGEKVVEPYVQHVYSFIYPVCANLMAGKDNPCHRDNFGPLTVPKNKVFVMGDNRDQSYDSRYWGFVDLEAIKGKALIIYWSWDPNDSLRFKRIGKIVK